MEFISQVWDLMTRQSQEERLEKYNEMKKVFVFGTDGRQRYERADSDGGMGE